MPSGIVCIPSKGYIHPLSLTYPAISYIIGYMTQSEFERNRQTYLRMHDNQDILVRSSYTRGDFRKRLDQAIRYLDLARDGVNGNGWPINEERREDFFDLG